VARRSSRPLYSPLEEVASEEITVVAEAAERTAERSLDDGLLRADAIARGTAIGRYIALGVLGSGAMGIVVLAYDPDLDRRVAIKLLRARSDDGSVGRALLLREAQAMARLNHPNVVTVHDVGEHEARVYIAMELVEGTTLREWQAERKRPWSEIVAVYRQAGAGLAAAHAAGVVHRDFKPDNVLVAADGRVLVTDFGLARADLEPHTEADAEISSSGWELTRTGTIAGTPAYMSPEQLAGRSADAQSDQFAFCVSLFEALHGTRPYTADSLPELARVVSEGAIREPDTPVGPGWLRAAIRRGLAVDPTTRHASMPRLLELLARDPSRARRRWAVLAGGGLLVTAVVASAARSDPESQLCRAGEERVAAVWDPARADTIAAAFEATTIPHAPGTWAATRERFEAWAPAWAAAHRDTCEATHVRGEQSGSLLDARMSCLQRQLDKVEALLVELGQPDETTVERTASATSSLPDPSSCEDPAGPALPSDPAARERIEKAQRALAIAHAKNELGRYASGIEAALEASTAAGDDAPALTAEALLVEAQLRHRNGEDLAADETIHRALRAAAIAHDDGTAAEAWIELTFLTGHTRARHEDAVELLLPAELAVERTDRDDLRRRFHDVAGVVLTAANRRDEALEHHRKALASIDERTSDEAISTMTSNYGNSLYEAARYEDARAQFEVALEASRRASGDEHPSTATDMFNLARAHGALADYDRARELYAEAIRIRETALGTEHRLVAEGRLNFGLILARQGDHAGGRAQIERALAIWEKTLEADHPYLGIAHNNLGTIADSEQRWDDAIAEFREAEAIARRRFGERSIRRVAPLLNQGNVHTQREDYDAAIAVFDEAIGLNDELQAPDHPGNAYPLVGKGKALVEMGRPADALPLLERALKLREGAATEPAEMYLTCFTLALALWDSDTDRPRAIELAQRAKEAYAKTGLDWVHAESLTRWLSEHASEPEPR
jgi:tetratricopeptide (TPR) repeat protein